MEDFAGSVVTKEVLREAIMGGNTTQIEQLLAHFGLSKMSDPTQFDATQKRVALTALSLTCALAYKSNWEDNSELIRSVIEIIAPKIDIFSFLYLVVEGSWISVAYRDGCYNLDDIPEKIRAALCNNNYYAEFDDEVKRVEDPEAMVAYISLSGYVEKLSFKFSRPILLCLFDRRNSVEIQETQMLSYMGFSLRDTIEENLIDTARAHFMGQ